MTLDRLLVVEDDPAVCFSLRKFLSEAGYQVDTAFDGDAAWNLIESENYPVILSDIHLPGLDGKKILQRLHSKKSKSQLILFTAYGNVQDAVTCIKNGAFDYFTKPVDNEKLLLSIKRAFEHISLLFENEGLKEKLGESTVSSIAFRSRKMEALLLNARIAADNDANILITGESGTGKTLLAKHIHRHSRRSSHPFVEVSCGALTESLLESELFGHKKGAFTGASFDKKGKFEFARGGTIFLDDINSSSLAFQVKLLRVIEEKVFERVGDHKTIATDVRIIAATNADLLKLSHDNRFREDLYHRLNVISLRIPRLAERQEDIPVLTKYFLSRCSARHNKHINGVDDEVVARFTEYPWPGNVRELENTIERMVIFCRDDYLGAPDLPDFLDPNGKNDPLQEELTSHPADLCHVLEECEKLYISKVLQMNNRCRSKTAESLKISRATLFNKMKKYNIY